MFIQQQVGVRDSNRFVWFEDWVIGRQTIEQISKESGYPQRILIRYFHAYLSKQPVFSVYPSERVNLLIDGTYFNNDLCLVLYRDNTIKFTQLYRLTNGEWYEELKEDLENLLKLGVQIESITCDGHKALLKAIRKVCKHATLQRCLVHIQRMCKVWLTTRPQSQAGIELRRICGKLHLIRTPDERDYWLASLVRWHEQHHSEGHTYGAIYRYGETPASDNYVLISKSAITYLNSGTYTALAVQDNGVLYAAIDRIYVEVPLNLSGYTVATLPAGSQGDVAYVTDALSPAYLSPVIGGGSTVTRVFYDGAAWVA